MYLNRFIFPAPQSSYSADILKDNLVWVQRPKSQAKPSGEILKRPGEVNEEIKLDPSSEFGQRMSFGGFDSFKRSEIDQEFGATPDMFVFNTGPQRTMGSVGGFKSLNNLDIEKPSSIEQLSPRQSIPEFQVRINDYPKDQGFKKQHKGSGGCFGFFSKPKSKSRVENPRVLHTRNSDITSKRDMMRSEPDLTKPRSMSIEPLSKSVNFASKNTVKIPCLHLKCSFPTTKTLLFFHSNGEDIYLTYELLKYMSEYLLVDIFILSLK